MNYIDKKLINVSLGREPADLVIQNGTLVDVILRRTFPGGIAISSERIAAIGDVDYAIGEETTVIDATGCYLVPGLIDPHVHPEVSKMSINRFTEAALALGTTSILCSFDQANVIAGIDCVRFLLDEVKKTPLKVFHSGPSRLPYTTPASTVAQSFKEKEHDQAMSWEESNGMWEYMVESIEWMEAPVLYAADKLIDSGRLAHGHLPFTFGPRLNAAAAAGVRDDHESWFPNELFDKTRVGIYSYLRKASCVDNIKDCIKAVTELGLTSEYICLCTDDVDGTDLTENGYMDHLVRYAIQLGVDPITAIQMCSINCARANRVDHLVGSLAPGRFADILFVKDLTEFKLERVIANGKVVAENGKLLVEIESPKYPEVLFNTMHLNKTISEADVQITVPTTAKEADALVMQVLPNQIRVRMDATLPVKDGVVLADPQRDICFISVTDRHTGKGTTATTFISGYGLQNGAFATSLSPDDDNIICIGTNAADMAFAINRLFEIKGGQIVVADGKVMAELPLPICGIMSDLPIDQMIVKEKELDEALQNLGVIVPKPFFSILFLSITAIPQYAITDQGFVDYSTKDYVEPVQAYR